MDYYIRISEYQFASLIQSASGGVSHNIEILPMYCYNG